MKHWQDYVMVGIVVLETMLAAVINAEPGKLGVPPLVLGWLAIINVGLVVAANQLKALGASHPTPPIEGG